MGGGPLWCDVAWMLSRRLGRWLQGARRPAAAGRRAHGGGHPSLAQPPGTGRSGLVRQPVAPSRARDLCPFFFGGLPRGVCVLGVGGRAGEHACVPVVESDHVLLRTARRVYSAVSNLRHTNSAALVGICLPQHKIATSSSTPMLLPEVGIGYKMVLRRRAGGRCE